MAVDRGTGMGMGHGRGTAIGRVYFFLAGGRLRVREGGLVMGGGILEVGGAILDTGQTGYAGYARGFAMLVE